MTIAAGFRCNDGVVIGADSLVENLEVKYEEDKIFNCSAAEDYEVLMVGSGDTLSIKHIAGYALDEKVFDAGKGSTRGLRRAIRELTKSEAYQDATREAKDAQQPIELLFALKAADKQTDLIYLYESRFHTIPQYECIGTGSSTARYFSKWLYDFELSGLVMGALAVQILKTAKQHNVGCEGESKVMVLLTGTTADTGHRVINDALLLGGLHDLIRPIYLGCADARLPDTYFQKAIDDFCGRARQLRENALSAAAIRGASSAVRRATIPDLLPTTIDPSRPQPSPESPGGSDES